MTVYSRGLRALASEKTRLRALESVALFKFFSLVYSHSKVKFPAAFIALFGSAAAFAPSLASKKSSALAAFSVDSIPGGLAPVGLFDPLGATLKRYREDELTHGRVAALAVHS